MSNPRLIPADLAPGDDRALAISWSGLAVLTVDSPDHPWFSRAYDRLWAEFGARGEMESRDVIRRRLAAGLHRHADHLLAYSLLVVCADGQLVAVRDHTAAVPLHGPPGPSSHAAEGRVVVHLSHTLIDPAWRGGGLAGWLRAFPLQTARACAVAAGRDTLKITLAGEMDPPDDTPAVRTRLRSYGRAGFRLVDPAIAYAQPDFRAPAEIDRTGVRPIPLVLIVRRVGDEHADTITGAELRALVTALYAVYAAHQRPSDMAPLWARIAALPPAAARVALRPP